MPDNLSDRPSKKRPLELILGALVYTEKLKSGRSGGEVRQGWRVN
jgi:hypothetical protein